MKTENINAAKILIDDYLKTSVLGSKLSDLLNNKRINENEAFLQLTLSEIWPDKDFNMTILNVPERYFSKVFELLYNLTLEEMKDKEELIKKL